MFFSNDEWPGGKNLAISPAVWDKMFEIIPSPTLGLNYDPSHLVWQMMDPIQPIYDYKDRLHHIHLKDAKLYPNKLNRVGIMVDVSHISDSSFFDVVKLSKIPVIASHSSCRKFTPGWQRNMSDDQLKALGKNGGVIQINFGSTFLDSKIPEYNNKKRDELNDILKKAGLKDSDAAAKPLIEDFGKKNPKLYADVKTVADHIDHVVKLIGIDHVGIGSDFDGVGDSLPTGLKDVSQYPNLIFELLKRGYSEEDIAKICSKNVLRVWKAVEKAASKS
jgi:membrane dipeptidase